MPFICRVPVLLFWLLALGLTGLALACFPPILGNAILAAGALEPGAETVAFYVVSLLLLAAALGAARRARRLWSSATEQSAKRVRFALVTFVLGGLLALAGLEAIARIAMPLEKVLPEESRQRYQWASNRPASGQLDAKPRYASDRYDVKLGWAPTENYRSEGINFNSAGFRGVREFPKIKPEGETRIVVTGDSFTWGEDVLDDEVYTEELDRLLDGTSVVNIGVHGYGTDQQYLRLEQVGFDYDPDLVVLAYYKTNAARNMLAFRSYAKPRFRLVDDELRLENVPVPAPDDPSVLEVPSPVSYLGSLLARSWRRIVDYTRFAPQWELTRAILDATVEETRRRGAVFMLLYIPAARPTLSPVPEAAEAMLAEWAAETGEPFLNLRPLFLELPAKQQARLYSGHWTAEGHRVAARLIAGFVETEGLLEI